MTRDALLLAVLFCLLNGCSSDATIMRWGYTGGPVAQNVATVLPDAKSSGTVYAALTSGEITVSTNGGKTWSTLSIVTRRRTVYHLVQDPDRTERIFAATEVGAFLSTDRAKGWTALRIAEEGTGIRVLTIDPWTPTVMFAGTQGKGIFRSTDGGASWTDANSSSDVRLATADVYDIAIDLAKPDYVYAAASPPGIVRSTDAGRTWTTMTEDFSASGVRATHLLIKKNGAGVILFGTNAGSIMKSTNAGQSWGPSRNGLEADRILALRAHPSNPELVFAGTEAGIVVSSDFGASWGTATADLPRIATQLAIGGAGASPAIYAYGCGIGLKISSDNGASWRPADEKLGGSTVEVMTSDLAGDRLFAAVGNTCMAYTPGTGGGWVTAGTGITGGGITSLSPDPENAGCLYATTPGGVFQSTDGGVSWQTISRALRMAPTIFAPHPSIRTRVFAASDQGLFVSTDRGRTWAQPRPLGTHWRVHALTFSPTNAGTILGATSNAGVIVTRDGGFVWEAARYGLSGDSVQVVALDDKDPDVYFAYMAGGDCYRSINKGLEWNRYAPPWKTTDMVKIASDRFQPSSVVALVNNRELIYSPSGGSTWIRILDAPVNAEIVSLYWNASSAIVYAGALDKGVFRIPIGKKLREVFGE